MQPNSPVLAHCSKESKQLDAANRTDLIRLRFPRSSLESITCAERQRPEVLTGSISVTVNAKANGRCVAWPCEKAVYVRAPIER